MTFAYAPFNFWPLAFLCIAIIMNNAMPSKSITPKEATQHGFIFGLGWFGAGISWVHVAIADFGGLPLIVSLILMLILCAYLAIYPALAFGLSAKLYHKTVTIENNVSAKYYLWIMLFLPIFYANGNP